LLLGHLLQWGLFGALSVQVYIYYLMFPNDPPQRKVLVYAVYTIELVQAILLARMASVEFAAGFGNYEALDTIGLLSLAVPILGSIVTAVVQIFYAYRIRLFSENYLIPSVVVLCALIQLAGGLAVGVIGFQKSFFSQLKVRETLIASGLWNGSSAVCDVIIASSMTYYLSYWQKKLVLQQTQRMVQRLSRLIIETGTLTAVIAIINLIMYQIPDVTYYQTTSAVLGKIYSNAMMMNLVNTRMAYDLDGVVSNELPTDHRKPVVFSTSHGGISVTREEWTDEESSSSGQGRGAKGVTMTRIS